MPLETFEALVANSFPFCRYVMNEMNVRLGDLAVLVHH
jgi:hypothetical protein